MKRVTLTAFMVFGVWLSFGQTARLGDLNRNSVVVTSAPPQSVVSVNGHTGAVSITAASLGALTAEQDLAALRAYHYGSPDIVESPAEWFVFDGAGTITEFNWSAGRENVVIPWAIGGVPVTAIGTEAFGMSGIVSLIAPQTVTSIGSVAFGSCPSLASVSLPQAQTIGGNAFADCPSLASVSLPQATAIGDYAFRYCGSLTSVSLPQAQTIGVYTFGNCGSLTSVTIPQVTSIDNRAFRYCGSLASVRMGRNAPAEATGVFANITPPPTVYVTDPQATGWGAEWNGAPVVRPPLYGSSVTAQAFTLNGDTITEWPSGGGGGETSIIAPLYESGTNVVVTSTQSVYSVAVTGAGPVGIDWSGLALDGTGLAEVTLRLNVTEWAGTNVTFSPSLTFDATPEILVTGVWEFAASTIDGVTTRVSQTWPEETSWEVATITKANSINVNGLPIFSIWSYSASGIIICKSPLLLRLSIDQYSSREVPEGGMDLITGTGWGDGTDFFFDRIVFNMPPWVTGTTKLFSSPIFYRDTPSYAPVLGYKIVAVSTNTTVFKSNPTGAFVTYRTANANERAAYEAGWRP